MADLHTSMCLEWKTQIPSLDAPRESPKFSFMDYEWNFVLKCSNGLYSLCLLRNTAATCRLSFKVTVFIQDPSSNGTPVRSRVSTFHHSGTSIWRDTISDVSLCVSNFGQRGELKFVCIFHHDTVSKVPLESGRTHFATQSNVVLRLNRVGNFGASVIANPSANSANISPHLESLSRDLSAFLEDETLSDVKLKCGDRTISGHRSILAARSEVFAAMFRNKMVEGESGMVNIEDLECDVLELLLRYMYSGKIPDFCQDTACSVYEAADKYAVHALKKACSEWMAGHLTEENCLDVLVLADKHSDDKFVEMVVGFVAEYLHLLGQESWAAFKNEHPLLSLSVYEKRLVGVLHDQALR